jgi:hypothetical protein
VATQPTTLSNPNNQDAGNAKKIYKTAPNTEPAMNKPNLSAVLLSDSFLDIVIPFTDLN